MATVLVVDDECVIRGVLRRFLEKEGHEVLEAEDGLVALEYLEAQAVDLAIVDLMMPRMDGFELLRDMERNHRDTEVIVISGVQNQLARARERFEIRAAIGKPFELKELAGTVRDVLGRAEDP